MSVRVRPAAPMNKQSLAYIVGVAIGDGNLSNPNGRAVRLRITCDAKYPGILKNIQNHLHLVMPTNKISLIQGKRNFFDISCYSNKWEKLLGWKAKGGPKHAQNISIPTWIKNKKSYSISCLKGLFETDGSVYKDRKYLMINFVTAIPSLAFEIKEMLEKMGFQSTLQIHKHVGKKDKYTLRIAKKSQELISLIHLQKK